VSSSPVAVVVYTVALTLAVLTMAVATVSMPSEFLSAMHKEDASIRVAEFEYVHCESGGRCRQEKLFMFKNGLMRSIMFVTQGGSNSGLHGCYCVDISSSGHEILKLSFNWRGHSGNNVTVAMEPFCQDSKCYWRSMFLEGCVPRQEKGQVFLKLVRIYENLDMVNAFALFRAIQYGPRASAILGAAPVESVGEPHFSEHQCLTEDGFIEGGEGCGSVDYGPARVQAECSSVESDLELLQEFTILDILE
jgi:hypothetical protein